MTPQDEDWTGDTRYLGIKWFNVYTNEMYSSKPHIVQGGASRAKQVSINEAALVPLRFTSSGSLESDLDPSTYTGPCRADMWDLTAGELSPVWRDNMGGMSDKSPLAFHVLTCSTSNKAVESGPSLHPRSRFA